MPRPWRPSPFLRFSILLHAGALPALALWKHAWPWITGTLLLDHLTGVAAGLSPRSKLLGPNLNRLSPPKNAVALTFDDGPDPETTPTVLAMLRRHQVSATFFLIGKKAARHSELTRQIAAEGHEIQNHSWSHSNWFWFHGPWRLRREIARTQTLLAELSGRPPRLFRAPAGIRSPLLEPLLAQYDLTLTSWTRRGFDTREGGAQAVLRRLTRDLSPGAVLLLHDGNSARDSDGAPVVVEVLPQLLSALEETGLQPQPLFPPMEAPVLDAVRNAS